MYDQLAIVYNKYRVVDMELRVTWINMSTTPLAVGIYFDNVLTDPTTYNAAAVLPYGQQRVLLSNVTSKGMQSITAKMNIAAGLGYEFNLDEDLSAGTSANPNQVLFSHLYAMPVDMSTTGSYRAIYWMKFIVRFYDLRNPGESLAKSEKYPLYDHIKEGPKEIYQHSDDQFNQGFEAIEYEYVKVPK